MGLLGGEEERVECKQRLLLRSALDLLYSLGAVHYSKLKKKKPTSNTLLQFKEDSLTGMLLSSCTSALGRPFLFPSAGSSHTEPDKMREKAISEFEEYWQHFTFREQNF